MCRSILTLFLVTASFLLSRPALAAEKVARVVVLATEERAAAMQELAHVLGGHLADLRVAVELVPAGTETADVREVVDRLRLAGQGAQAVPTAAVSIVQGVGELLLFVANREVREVRLAAVAEGEGWPAQCDTIAALVRSALLGWLETEAPKETAAAPLPSPPPAAPEAPPPAPEAAAHALRIGLGAGYALTVLHPDEPLIHGAVIGAELIALEHLAVQLDVRFGGPVRLDVPGEDIRFHRLPLCAGAAWRPFAGAVDFRLGAAFTLDVTHLEDRAASDSLDDTSLVHPGLTPFVELAVRPVEFLALFARVAADLYFRSYDYTWFGDTVLRYASAQPWFGAGVSLVAGVD